MQSALYYQCCKTLKRCLFSIRYLLHISSWYFCTKPHDGTFVYCGRGDRVPKEAAGGCRHARSTVGKESQRHEGVRHATLHFFLALPFFPLFFPKLFFSFRLLRGYLFLMWTEMNSFFCFLFVYVGKYRLLELPLEIGFERNAFLSNSVHQLFLFLKNESTHEYTSEEVLQHVTLSRT